MSYRNNADEMSMQDQINSLRETVRKNGEMSGADQYSLKMTKAVVSGILGIILLSGGLGYGCNHEDNATKKEIARMCPAVSPILAVGLKQADSSK